MSTYAQRVQLGPFFDGGALQGGAKLYHYAVGTSTLKDLYLDRAKGTTLAQPLVADADGIFNFFADGLYKLIIVGPDSTGPGVDVLYTLDSWQMVDPAADILWSEGTAVATASAISIGPEIWTHLTGSTTVATITMTTPFAWLVADGNFTLTASASLLTPAGIDLAVRQNDVLFVLNEGSGVVRISNHYQYDGQVIATQDSRTNSSDVGLTVRSTTSGTPAAGIGTDILLQAESADETPSDVVQVGGAFSDVSAGSEDSYWRVLLRVAGAALTECWRFAAAAAFKGILTHANTADRTYTFPNFSYTIDAGECYKGPSSMGSGSTRTLDTFTSATGNLSGVHFYDGNFTLNSAHTLTIPAGTGRLVIICNGTITINGTISGVGGGYYAAGSAGSPGGDGSGGTDQAAGGGGNGYTGAASTGGSAYDYLFNNRVLASGTLGGTYGGAGPSTPSSVTGASHPYLDNFMNAFGGASGGGGSGTGGNGGRGGATLVLIAPTIVIGATGVINLSGANGSAGTYPGVGSSDCGGGGGGGSGNLIAVTRSWTTTGTITLAGGTGGAAYFSGSGTGAGAGSAGAAGVKQINIYS